MRAAAEGHVGIVEMLLTYEDPSAAGRDRADSNVSVVAPASADTEAEEGWTALMLASEAGHPNVVELLLAHGATVDAKTADGDTALSLANDNGHSAVAELLSRAEVGAHEVADLKDDFM